MTRIFATSGESVGTFIRRRRLDSSCVDLLARPGLSVTAVAARWGSGNAGNFARSFRACYGLSPTDPRGMAETEGATAVAPSAEDRRKTSATGH